MADKTLKVNIQFGADTTQAENALSRLSTSLKNISNINVGSNSAFSGMQKEFNTAADAAIKLRTNLQTAFNADTKKLDLTKFNNSMKQSGMSLEKYRQSLSAIGPQGKAAFLDLSQAIMSSQSSLRQTNALAEKLWDTLKKTIGWQISSSVIHKFMGGIQQAYSYAQDLNKSLNDIRIVTGYDANYMANFAEQANKAAKALKTTTNEYSKASLIYFQQGLDTEEVQKRTDVTVKMANVTGQSAQEVSDQLTAVWNNFAEGADNLEYYADVMTALGAATASSSTEISTGMQKFAAVAETVGLSYEYAASALATVTAKTRESADTVGTAFKTIFERIDSLKLGETLDDGTDLTKYSQALASVGVNIKDANGEMRNMDDILDDIGAKWTTLNKDQQIALASSVAGVRQYNQFMALMNNWDYMQENLGVANSSAGTLNEQAETYAESWEAARKQVQAAAESLYSDLLDDKFFIGITKVFAGILNVTDKLIDSMGGLGTVLPGIVLLIDKIFGSKIQAAIKTTAQNIYYATSAGQRAKQQADEAFKAEALNQVSQMRSTSPDTKQTQAMAVVYEDITHLQQLMIKNQNSLTAESKEYLNILLEQKQAYGDELIAEGKQLDNARKKTNQLYGDIQNGAKIFQPLSKEDYYDFKKDAHDSTDNMANMPGRKTLYKSEVYDDALHSYGKIQDEKGRQLLSAELMRRQEGETQPLEYGGNKAQQTNLYQARQQAMIDMLGAENTKGIFADNGQIENAELYGKALDKIRALLSGYELEEVNASNTQEHFNELLNGTTKGTNSASDGLKQLAQEAGKLESDIKDLSNANAKLKEINSNLENPGNGNPNNKESLQRTQEIYNELQKRGSISSLRGNAQAETDTQLKELKDLKKQKSVQQKSEEQQGAHNSALQEEITVIQDKIKQNTAVKKALDKVTEAEKAYADAKAETAATKDGSQERVEALKKETSALKAYNKAEAAALDTYIAQLEKKQSEQKTAVTDARRQQQKAQETLTRAQSKGDNTEELEIEADQSTMRYNELNAEAELTEATMEAAKAQKAKAEAENAVIKAQQKLEGLDKTASDYAKQYETATKNLSKAQGRLASATQDVIDKEEALARAQRKKNEIETTKIITELSGKYGIAKKQLQQYVKEAQEGAQNTEDFRKKLEALARASTSADVLVGSMSRVSNTVSKVSKHVSGLSSAIMGLNSLRNAVNSWFDPDVSGWEKISSTLMGLSMTLPAINTLLTQMMAKEGIIGVITSRIYANKLLEFVVNKKINDEAAAKVILQRLGVAEEKLETAIKIINNVLSAKENASVSKRILLQRILNALSAEGLITAQLSLGVIGLILAAVAAIVAIAVLIVKHIKNQKTELEKLTEATKTLAQQAEQAEQAYSDLLETINKYKDATAALENLSKGTADFTKNLIDANTAAWDIINTLGLTEGKGYTIDGGKVIIDMDSAEYQGALEEQKLQVAKMQIAAEYVEIKRQEAENKNNLVDYIKDETGIDFADSDLLEALASSGAATLSEAIDFVKENNPDLIQDLKDDGWTFYDGKIMSRWGKSIDDTDYQGIQKAYGKYLGDKSQTTSQFKAQAEEQAVTMGYSDTTINKVGETASSFNHDNYDYEEAAYLESKGYKYNPETHQYEIEEDGETIAAAPGTYSTEDIYKDLTGKETITITKNEKKAYAESLGYTWDPKSEKYVNEEGKELDDSDFKEGTDAYNTILYSKVAEAIATIPLELVKKEATTNWDTMVTSTLGEETGKQENYAVKKNIQDYITNYKDTEDQQAGLDQLAKQLFGKDATYEDHKDDIDNLIATYTEYKTVTDNTGEYVLDATKEEDQFAATLVSQAANYSSCSEELKAYNKAVQENGKHSKAAKKAQDELNLAVKNAKWETALPNLKDTITALKDLKKAFGGEKWSEKATEVANAFNDAFGTNIDADFIKDNYELIEEWSNSSGEVATNLGNQIWLLAEHYREAQQEIEKPIKIDLDSDGAIDELEKFTNYYDAIQAAINNGMITINAQGKADFTQLIDAMLAAGATAQEVGKFLSLLGASHLEFEGIDAKAIQATITELRYESTDVGDWQTNPVSAALLASRLRGQGYTIRFSGEVPEGGLADLSTINTGGGGGGSSYKAKSRVSKDNRYHTVDKQNETAENKLQQQQQKTELSYGKAKLESLKEEIILNKELIKIQKAKYNEAMKYLSLDKQELLNAASALGKAINFDANGNISNATELLAWLNQEEATWNDKDDSDEKAKYQEKLSLLKDTLSEYEDTLGIVGETQTAIIDAATEAMNKYVEIADAALEIHQQLSELKLNILEYDLEKIGDNAYRMGEKISKLKEKIDINISDNKAYLESINTVLSALNITYEDLAKMTQEELINLGLSQEQIDSLSEKISDMLDNNAELTQARTEALEEFNSASDKYREDIDYISNQMEHYIDLLSTFSEVNELLGLDQQKAINESLIAAKRQTIIMQKENLAIMRYQQQQLQSTYEQALHDASTEEAKIQVEVDYEEPLRNAADAVQEAESNFTSSWSEALSQVQEAYESMLENIVTDTHKAFAGIFESMDIYDLLYESAGAIEELYVSPISAAIQLQQLENDIQRQIADTDSLESKEKLRAILKDITKLEEQENKITQHDLDLLQAQYDVEIAREKLKDAKTARNSVMLSRGANGNWGYVYTVNQDAIDQAEKDYGDKIQHLMELNDDYIKNLSDNIKELRGQALEQLQQIWNDITLSVAGRTQSAEQLLSDYETQLIAKSGELEKVLSENMELTPMLMEMFNLSEDEIIDTFGETVLGKLTAMAQQGDMTVTELTASIMEALRNANQKMMESAVETEQSIENINADAEMADPTTAIQDGLDKLSSQASNTASEFETLGVKITNAFDSGLQALISFEDKISTLKLDDIVSHTEDVVNNIQKALETWSTFGSVSVISSISEGLNNLTESYIGNKIDSATYTKGIAEYSQQLADVGKSMTKFDTGGYTGTWGDDGRLAILHQKELVLNQDDTVNLLKAVSLVQQIELSAQATQSMLSDLQHFVNIPQIDNMAELQQAVTITAEFPNVVDHSEIEMALNNLVNEASQYANRKF